jgi:hypothetical protein
MPLPGTIGRIEAVVSGSLHAELTSYAGDGTRFDFLGFIGEPAMCPVEQQQQGKVHPVRLVLGHDERKIRRCQRPAIGDVNWECRITAELRLQKYAANARTFARASKR